MAWVPPAGEDASTRIPYTAITSLPLLGENRGSRIQRHCSTPTVSTCSRDQLVELEHLTGEGFLHVDESMEVHRRGGGSDHGPGRRIDFPAAVLEHVRSIGGKDR